MRVGAVIEKRKTCDKRLPGKAWRPNWMALTLLGLLAFGGMPRVVQADSRVDYLTSVLRTSKTFRVRAQAAISLGRVDASSKVVGALSGALRDSHPAVRLAAASSLERLGDPSALSALNRQKKDRNGSVRKQVRRAIAKLERALRDDTKGRPSSRSGRYYVSVSMPGAAAKGVDKGMLRDVRRVVSKNVSSIDGVVLAPEKESTRSANKVLKRSDLIGYSIESSVVRLEPRSGGVRAVVSVILGTYPGHDIRAMMQGAATVPGARGKEATLMAIQGAIQSAMQGMKQAMVASEARSYHVRR